MAFHEYYVDFELKKLTSAYSFPPFGEVVLLSLKSTGEGNEVAMDKFLAICREILDHLPRNPGPYAKKPWIICRECRQILGHLPRLPRTICRECQQILGHLPRLPRTICRECQQILGHLPRLPRTAIKICLPRMPSLPWLALAAGSFGSLGSR